MYIQRTHFANASHKHLRFGVPQFFSRSAWRKAPDVHGLPKAQSKSHLHEVLPNSQTAKHFDTNYEYSPNCLQRIFSQTSKHAEIGWKTMGKKGQIRDPRSATLSWIELAPSGLTRPSINFMSRIFHAGLGGQWKSKNADILAGFPVCIDFQLSFCSAWRCKAFMDLVCKLSPWLIDAAMSCSGSIGLGIHVLPFIHVDLSHWPSGWIRSIKFMSNSLVADRDQQIHHTVSMTPWCFSLSHFDLVSGRGLCHSSMPDLLVTAVKRSDTNSMHTAQRSTTSEKPSIPLRHCTFIRILSMARCNPYQWAVQSSTDSKYFKILPLRPRNWNLSHRRYLTSSRLFANVSI